MTILDQLRLLRPGWRDLIEVAIVAFVLYRVLLLFHGTRAVQMLAGIAILVSGYAAAWALNLHMITYLLGLVFTYGAFAALVIFQPELRSALAHLGQSRVTRFFRRMETTEVIGELLAAVERLSRSGVGAIIVIEREQPLGEYVRSGSVQQAKVSADLLATIFTPYSPLHDGAVIVRGDSIVGAGCILPLSQAALDDRSLGTRHRAALGLSEETDALVVVVSEETAAISVASGGQLMRRLTTAQLREVLAGRPLRTTAEYPAFEVRA
ncbi:MAG TPA: diadenylate cyclase CdaA [Gemmatimonadaceae bacterium]|nr:diadenylate cyclase CdaA [Gemmatimonadaceae bacterium]